MLPALQNRFAGLNADLGRERQEQKQTLRALARNTTIALGVIYAIIAVALRSYAPPLAFLPAASMAWCWRWRMPRWACRC